jgi:hypothetical protein
MQDSPLTQRLGRTALLVQGLGLLSAGIVAAAMIWLGMESGEGYAIVAVASAAAGVFIFWSAVLAIRAIRNGERARWPMAVVLLVLFEIAAPCLALWAEVVKDHHNAALNFMIWQGLPVFGPFIAIGSLIAAPLALWRARKAEAVESAAGVKSWRRKTWKVWLAWYAGVMAGLGIFLLPGPLVILGTCATQFYSSEFDRKFVHPDAWPAYLAAHSPNFLMDGIESLFNGLADPLARRFLDRTYELGYVSDQRVLERLCDATVEERELDVLDRRNEHYSDVVPAYCDKLLHGGIKTPARMMLDSSLIWIARHGTAEQLHAVASGWQDAYLFQREKFLSEVDGNKNVSAIAPQLQELAVSRKSVNPEERDAALMILSHMLKCEELTKLWRTCLESDDSGMRASAARCFRFCVQQVCVEPGMLCLECENIFTRREAIVVWCSYRDGINPRQFRRNPAYRPLIRCLYQRLDDNDVNVRMAAACLLGDIFREGEGDALRGQMGEKLITAREKAISFNFWHDPTLEPEERDEITKDKELVGTWLKENATEK